MDSVFSCEAQASKGPRSLPQKFLNRLLATVEGAIGPGFRSQRYLVAVSGGMDSMVLLDCMAACLDPGSLAVAHFQHHMRGLDSIEDERFVEAKALELGLRYVRGDRNSHKVSETALRAERWAFLKVAQKQLQCDFVVTAHHLQDQTETLLMNLVRGCGLKGLGSMEAESDSSLRPLLSFSKEEIGAYAGARGLAFREDASNRDPICIRNRMRNQVLPLLLEEARPFGGSDAFFRRVGDTIAEAQQAYAQLLKVLDSKLPPQARVFPAVTSFWTSLRLSGWLSLEPFWQRLWLRRFYDQLRRTVSRDQIEDIRGALERGSRKLTAPGNVLVQVSCGYIFFQFQKILLPPGAAVPVRQRGFEVAWPHLGIQGTLEHFGTACDGQDGGAWRFFEPGDRWEGKKLKEFFLKWSIPAPERWVLPLYACGRQVQWVLGQPEHGFIRSSSASVDKMRHGEFAPIG